MSPERHLREIAEQIAANLQGRTSALQREFREIEARKAQIEAELQALHLAHDRFLGFTPSLDGQLQCPRCWVEDDIRAAMRPISGTDTEDLFRCSNCQFEFSIPFKG